MKTRFVLISGMQGSGKTTLAKSLKANYKNAVLLKFADPLYSLHEKIWNVMEDYGLHKSDYIKGAIDARLLQLLGSDWARAMNKDIWVNVMRERVKQYGENALIIVDDCRFPNELDCFPEENTVFIRLECDEKTRQKRAEKWRTDTAHVSETALNGVRMERYDFVFDTESSSTELMTDLIIEAIQK